jgi:predicted amidophosphoribosyltransferase
MRFVAWVAHMQNLAQKASRLVASVLFPDTCLACRMHVAARGTLCPDCWNRLHFIAEPVCAVTGTPFQHEFGDNMVSADALPIRRPIAARAPPSCMTASPASSCSG